jgi:HK97 family phage major capsid protein
MNNKGLHAALLASSVSAMHLAGARMSPAERAMGRFMRDATGHENGGGGEREPAPEALAERIKASLEKTISTTKELAERAISEVKDFGETNKATAEKADEALLKLKELQDQLTDMEQKAAEARKDSGPVQTPGQQFVESDSFKKLIGPDGKRGRAMMEVKATITSATSDDPGSVGAAIQATRLPGIQALPQRRLTVRDLISSGQMDGNSLEYVQETGFTNNAAMVAEGGLKPGSDIQLELKTTGAKVIAHWMKASRQVLDDIPQLRSIIDQRLLFGLALKEEQQLLFGDGVGQNLFGIVPQATPYVAAFVPAAETAIDTMRLAMLQAVLAEYPATGHVLHPTDWARIELTKDDLGRYIIGNPQGQAAPTLWGLPVVATPAMTVDKFLTGAFKLGAQLFDRWAARVEVATENEDDFVKNLLTILAEQREALAVYRPEAFIYGDLGYVA